MSSERRNARKRETGRLAQTKMTYIYIYIYKFYIFQSESESNLNLYYSCYKFFPPDGKMWKILEANESHTNQDEPDDGKQLK